LLTDEFKNEPRKLDAPFSLFDGLGGALCFLIDLMDPDKADFPLMPVFDADPDIINPIIIQTSDKSKDDMKDDKDKKSKDNQKEHSKQKPEKDAPSETKEEPKQDSKQDSKQKPRPVSRQLSLHNFQRENRNLSNPESISMSNIVKKTIRPISVQEYRPESQIEKNFAKNDLKAFEIKLQELIKDLSELNNRRGDIIRLVENLMNKIRRSKTSESIRIKLEKKDASKDAISPDQENSTDWLKKQKDDGKSFYNALLNKLDQPKNKKVRFFEFAEQLPKRDWILIKSSNSNSSIIHKSL
jgi:hypothetical protein